MKTVLKNGNVFYQNKIQKLDVEIDGETISQIGHDLDGENIIDCTDLLVTPGFVDLHVHLREPGFEHKGTIKTETLSAKYGGYTHIVLWQIRIHVWMIKKLLKILFKEFKKIALFTHILIVLLRKI